MSHTRRIFACSSVALDYFRFLLDSLAASADEVIAVTALEEDTYRRASRGSWLSRLWLRSMMYLAYPLQVALATFRAAKGDLFVVTSNTFFAPSLVAMLVRWRGVRVVHLLYDLFPDAMEVAGRLRCDGLASRGLGLITQTNQHATDGTVYLGCFLRDYAERRWGRTRRPGVIPIATDVRLYDHSRPETAASSPLTLHYGGQLGLMHDAESLLASLQLLAASGLLGSDVAFDGLVSGSRAAEFQAKLRGTAGISLGGTLSSAAWRRHVRTMQIGVVTLSPGGATVCLPSKAYAMMASGLAVVAVCPSWSDLAQLVEETGAGWVVNNAVTSDPLSVDDYLNACRATRAPADVASDFHDCIARLVSDPGEVAARRLNAWRAVRDRFSPDRISDAWTCYIDSLTADNKPR